MPSGIKMKTERSILVILFLIAALSIVFSITKNPQYNGYYTETKTKIDATVNLGTTATYSGTPLVSGDRVCMGAVDLTALTTSLYASDPAQTSIGVECTRYDPALGQQCAGYAGGSPGLPASVISWLSQSDYNTTVGGFNVLVCKTRDRLPLPTYTGITFRDISANYYGFSGFYPGDKLIGAGTASIALFCYGTSNLSYTYNGSASSLVPGSSLNLGTTLPIVFNNPVTNTGTYSFQANAIVANCSVLARSWNTYGTADSTHPAQDCLYKDPTGTMANLLVSGNSISITILRGPVMNITGSSIDERMPEGSIGSFSVTVKNEGDVNMTVNPATDISFDAGFSYVPPVPPAPILNLAPGENQTITGSVRAPANFLAARTVTISVSYAAAEALVGTCDDLRTASVVIGSVQPAPPDQLTLRVNVDPPGIIRGIEHHVVINVSVSRGGQTVEGTISTPNVSITSWNGSEWRCAPGWCLGNQIIGDAKNWGDDMYLDYGSSGGTNGFATDSYPVHYISGTGSPIGNDWPVGLYKVRVAVRDNRMSTYTGSEVIARRDTYFVIFTIGCEERS